MDIAIARRWCKTRFMVHRSVVFLLLLSLVAPLNSGAAAWMSLSMSEQGEPNQASTDDHRHADHPMHGDGHAHDQHADGHPQRIAQTSFSTSSSMELVIAELPMLAFTFTRKLRPMIIGSSSG